MTRKEAIFELIKIRRRLEEDSTIDAEPFDMAIEALDKPLPKPHERLMHWDTARRIIDSPRSKSQMLAVLDSVPPIEALEPEQEDYTEMKREFLRMASYIDVILECSDEQKETLLNFISRLAEFMPWTERD